MQRWHSERSLMLSRWRQEIRKHYLFVDGEVPFPPPQARGEDCHCMRGMGFLRKHKPFDCGKPRCGVCHPEKVREPKRRHRALRAALEFEREASGGW